MRGIIIISILLLVSFSIVPRQTESGNIAVIDSHGVIHIGAWFYYNFSSNQTINGKNEYFFALDNWTILNISGDLLWVHRHLEIQSKNMSIDNNYIMNASYGALPFWANTTLAIKGYFTFINVSYTVVKIYEVNDTYLEYLINDSHDNVLCWTSGRVWIGENDIIIKKTSTFYYKELTKGRVENETIKESEAKLVALWSPTLNNTQENETSEVNNETNKVSEKGGTTLEKVLVVLEFIFIIEVITSAIIFLVKRIKRER